MTVRTTYFGGLGTYYSPADDADVFGVVRHPREFVDRVTDRNIPAVGPPDDLLDAFKTVEESAEHDGVDYASAIAWNSVRFEERYRAHLEKPGPQRVLDDLRERALEHDVWFVCWEKDVRWCHRRVLANEIVADLDDVEIVHHPDPTMLEEEPEPTESDDGPTNASLESFQEGSP